MGCLMVRNKLEAFPDYKYFFDQDRWKDLIKIFKNENFKISSLTSQSSFNVSLQVIFY